MNKIVRIKILNNYRIRLKFNDGISKTVNFLPFIGKGFTKEILKLNYFKKATIEPGGGIAWPNGYDFCPDFLKEYVEITPKK
ncbi:MAG: hypothetical protein A3H98_14760 [Bacteroidetes bacterium RIFCSPLOWO2_02_FULL_36_8]|nr:MAG: hypothetical protein A3H98_14760 [Bacteroidetes bacterium RIFCSPLOWO2_02_FULL_36_8]OFY70093.1 MAG: hypothetical protein A3G23_11680 [Bacteroidetes bacterium RIFCSPLOWO2_12_FULL_37_12]